MLICLATTAHTNAPNQHHTTVLNSNKSHVSEPLIFVSQRTSPKHRRNSPRKPQRTVRRTKNMNTVGPSYLKRIHSTSTTLSDGFRFPFRAKALYSYKASEAEPLEFSFEEGEVFEIENPQGNAWWRARNKDGKLGIIPSNYFQLQ
ncbi:Transmembrane osmosensor [Coelomomyces lativittatus]|nr:Transmembrane osmosensor [Coelomomyces lativittatus]